MRSATLGMALAILLAACSAPSGTGVVIGGIEPCQGIIFEGGSHYAAGTVTVYAGELQWTSTSSRTTVRIFPSDVVTTVHVDEDSPYRLVLQPGDYVLRARYDAPSSVAPWLSVTVRAGQTTAENIPNVCI